MRASIAVFVAAVHTVVAAAERVCEIDAAQVVEHARKKGYRFEITRTSAAGTCGRDATESVFLASATSTAEVTCDVRIFSKRLPDASAAPAPSSSGAAATAGTPSTPSQWTITSIRVAGPDSSSLYAEEHVGTNTRSWAFQIQAPASQTNQYRIAKIEFTTQQKECSQWRDAF